jgi:5-methylthioadenosine/S-adenosylhomocysteine deaminase
MKNRKLLLAVFYFLSSVSFLAVGVHSQTGTPTKTRVDLLISGGTIVTMDAERHVYDPGAIAVRGDSIVAIGPRAEIEAQYAATRRINAAGNLVMPGLINGHTHVPMTLLRGIANDLNLQDWLTKYIFPAEARNVT